MPEGSTPDAPPASDPPAATPPAEPTEGQVDEVVAEARTPEEIETIWKNRVAGKDRAHAAEAATLRQQLEAERTTRARLEAEKTTTTNADLTEAEQWKTRAEAAERRATEVEQQRVLDVRTAKYGAAAELLDATTLAAMDEAKLAALNARLADEDASPSLPFDTNLAPKRSTASPSTPRERSTEELESDLKKYEPDFKAGLST